MVTNVTICVTIDVNARTLPANIDVATQTQIVKCKQLDTVGTHYGQIKLNVCVRRIHNSVVV